MSETIPSWARIGAKVVCILADWSPRERAQYWDITFPEQGCIYTIREVTTVYTPGSVAVRLAEIVNYPMHWADGSRAEAAFAAFRFRPLVSQADDIATHFAHHLDTRAPELV